MIQFNLLPDVKQEFMHANRVKHTVLTFSILVSAIAVAAFVLLFVWDGVQKHTIGNLTNEYQAAKSQLVGIKGINGILTIQNQLNTLPQLDSQKPVVSRLFGFLSQITPTSVSISSLSSDFQKDTMTISGKAGSIADVNTFADTLKFTTYSKGSNPATSNAFTQVVLSSFGINPKTNTVSYTLTFNFDPVLFESSNQISQLNIPPEITTRSIYDQPKFTPSTSNTTNAAGTP